MKNKFASAALLEISEKCRCMLLLFCKPCFTKPETEKKIVKTHENELELLNFNEWNEKMQNEITFYIGKSNKSLFWKKVDSRNRTSRPMS